QGVTPGPLLIAEHPEVFWGVVASMYIGNVLLLFLNLPLVGLWVQMLKVPYSILAPVVVMICSIGVYSAKNNPMDVIMMFIFGIVGYLLRKFRFELGPLLLAFVLGRIMERSLSQALLISQGDFSIFITKPISAIILAIVGLMLLAPMVKLVIQRFKAGKIAA
ncbi:MAG TPA: tripartite tricarboxylate transporter permease, partial [Bacillota bacterium]|nr:tripartite tricarboxylate transporter permease [Bacillota bacterium]